MATFPYHSWNMLTPSLPNGSYKHLFSIFSAAFNLPSLNLETDIWQQQIVCDLCRCYHYELPSTGSVPHCQETVSFVAIVSNIIL